MIRKFPTPFLVLDIVKKCLDIITTMIVHGNGGAGGGGVFEPDFLYVPPPPKITEFLTGLKFSILLS